MSFGRPGNPFFSYVSPNGGTLACILGVPALGLVPFQAFQRDLDMPTDGVWNPKEGTLALHGDDGFVTLDAVTVTGPYLVIEKDGSLTVEPDGERHLQEGETLVTPSLLDTLRPGRRHAALKEWAQEDEEDAQAMSDMVANDDVRLGRPFSTL